jgi:two-component system sensor histidine kinase DctS
MGSIIDIADRKAAAELSRIQSESLARTGRLVTLGETASTLAHEINQPLGAIASYAAGCLNFIGGLPESETRDDMRAALWKLAAQADRAGQIIRRIQDFVRKREPRFAALDLGPLIEETIVFVGTDLRTARVRVDMSIEPDLPQLDVDRILIQQLLINLIRNGAEAMAQRPESERCLYVAARKEVETNGVVIEVADQGCGIDSELASRLFDAFVSTKPEGMGMGLNICRSIVELHKGRLTHRAQVGGGTIFSVDLPLHHDSNQSKITHETSDISDVSTRAPGQKSGQE